MTHIDSQVAEMREIAEEELSFVKDFPTPDRVVVSRRTTYKRLLALCAACEEKQKEIVRKDRRIARQERQIERFWKFIEDTERLAYGRDR